MRRTARHVACYRSALWRRSLAARSAPISARLRCRPRPAIVPMRYRRQRYPVARQPVMRSGFSKVRRVPAQWWTRFRQRRVEPARRAGAGEQSDDCLGPGRLARGRGADRRGPRRAVSVGRCLAGCEPAEEPGLVHRRWVPASPYTIHNASIDVGYTLDLFGGVRRGIEAQSAIADCSRFQLDGTYLSLAANVVTTSIREASLRGQIRATEEITEVYQPAVRSGRQAVRDRRQIAG